VGLSALLHEARSALELRETEAALGLLLQAWSARRAPEIASLVDRVSARLPASAAIKGRNARERFLVREALAKPIDLPGQIASLVEGELSMEGVLRVRAMAHRPPDPRMATLLLETLRGFRHLIRYRSSYHEFWHAVLDVLPTHADPRLSAPLRALVEHQLHWQLPYATEEERATLVTRILALATELEAQAPAVLDPGEESTLVAALAERLTADEQRQAAVTSDLATLEAAVFAAPDDDAPRLVLADQLQLSGDPRGEFIALQIAATRGELRPKDRGRMNAFAKKQRARLLGPLADWIMVDGLVFERGFPARGAMRNNAQTAFPEVDAWSTFVELTMAVNNFTMNNDEYAVLFRGPWARGLRRLHYASYATVRTMAACGLPRRIEHIHFLDYSSRAQGPLEQLAELMANGVLPSLRSVDLWIDRDSRGIGEAVPVELARRLAKVGFHCHSADRTTAAALRFDLPVQELALGLAKDVELLFRRAADGGDAFALEVRGAPSASAIPGIVEMLDAVPRERIASLTLVGAPPPDGALAAWAERAGVPLEQRP